MRSLNLIHPPQKTLFYCEKLETNSRISRERMKPLDQKALEIAEFYFRSNQPELSKSILLNLVSEKKGGSKCYELLAYIYGNEGNQQETKRYLSIACSYTDASAEVNYYFGKVLNELGQFDEAIKFLEKVIDIAGGFFEVFFELGVANANLKNYLNAEKYFQKALFFQPSHVEALFNLAKVHHESSDNLQANIKLYSHVLEVQESHVPSLIGLGELYEKLDEFENAINFYKQVIKISPFNKVAWLGLGKALSRINQIDDAFNFLNESFFDQRNADLFYIKGVFHLFKRNFDCALENFDTAIKISSENPEAWEGKAFVEFALGLHQSAFLSIEKSLLQNNKSASAWKNRGNFYADVENYELAIKSYEKAIELDPSIPLLINDYLNAKLKSMSWDDIDHFYQKARTDQNLFFQPLTLLYLSDDPNFIYINNKKYSRSLYKRIGFPFQYKNSINKKVRLAYLSSDFRNHPVSYLMRDIFKFHNRDKFEIYGFFINNKNSDYLTEEIKILFDHFIDLTELSDAEAIDLLRNFDIDIAFDLTGHTQYSRTNIFLNRVAKFQINFIGYPNTMGDDMYDYIIADNYLVSQNEAKFFSEKIIYFPYCFQPNSHRYLEMTNDDEFTFDNFCTSFVYCCFNYNSKISKEMLELWVDILNETHDSVLWLYVEPHAVDNLTREIKKMNSSVFNRIRFLDRSNYETYFSRFKLANLFLDTFPFGGGTTTSDALLSGLPVLTLAGNSYHNRMSKSLLHNLNLRDLVSDSRDSYRKIAVRLCNDPAYYKSVKLNLKKALSNSAVFDPITYTKNLESFLLDILKHSS